MAEPMKPIIMVVLDGGSDRASDGKTPLESATIPNLDALVRKGALGSMYTVGNGIAPESDAGVFSLLGYDPLQIHLSRGVVESIGAGVDFHDGDLALRAGFATVEGDKLVDRRAGRNLSTEEARQLARAVNSEVRLKDETRFRFQATVGHRAVVDFGADSHKFSSDISNFDPAYVRTGKISVAQPSAREYDIPKCEPLDDSPEAIRSAALVNEFGFKSRSVLESHPVNEQRRMLGKKPANFVLMRDAGTARPIVEGFKEKWNLKAAMIADLPAELGIGRLLEMDVREIPPGTSMEDYRKRAELVLRLAGEFDFVYVHLKGPDEPGHDGLYDLKKKRIEEIDAGFFAHLRMAAKLQRTVLCVTCDHSTPCKDRGHSDDPVPVLVAGGSLKADGSTRFTERNASAGGFGMLEQGGLLLPRLEKIAAEPRN
jgi:2,3-bisphosphoglycerate-independent phosphoglycerate mutase